MFNYIFKLNIQLTFIEINLYNIKIKNFDRMKFYVQNIENFEF